MGLLKKENKKQNTIVLPDDFTTDEKDTIYRLCSYVPNIITMLKSVLVGNNGTDMYIVLLYAAGLAGIACHETVKELGEEMVVVECKDGRKYYMGDAINYYLHESKTSVTGFVRTITQMPEEALMSIISKQSAALGTNNFVVEGNINPIDLYKIVKQCWDGIKDNMTLKYCKCPEEWPILYGIVLQNIIVESMNFVSKETLFNTSVDVACALSKIAKESL